MQEDTNTRRADAAAAQPGTSDQEYKVGPGRPPKEYQFKPGQSGNPKGARRKPMSIVPDLKAMFQKSLEGKVKLKQGETEKTLTKAALGFEQLANQFAKGDRHARRDVFALAQLLGVDLRGEQANAVQQSVNALSGGDQALLDDYYLRRRGGECGIEGAAGADEPEGPPELT